MGTKDNKKKQKTPPKLIKRRQARRALYVDFEGTDTPGSLPVLLGVLFDVGADDSEPRWQVRRFVFDARCAAADAAAAGGCEVADYATALGWLLDLSDAEKRHVVTWSRHDRDVIDSITDGRDFRWRNAIPTAKRWRKQQRAQGVIRDDGGPNDLRRYERWVEYHRPLELLPVGTAIRRLQQVQRVTPGTIRNWRGVLDHNEHDLQAMRRVVWMAVNLTDPTE
jgi:hypothetical protein